MRTIAISNHKGGSGKSTTCVNLAAALAEKERKTLLIDLDAQCSATHWYGVKDSGPGVFAIFAEEGNLDDLIQPTEVGGVALVPASAWLTTADKTLAGEIGAETILRRKMEEMDRRLRKKASRARWEPNTVTVSDYLKYGEKDPERLWQAKLLEAEPAERERMIEERTRERTERVRSTRYDYVLVDCPPSLGILLVNALAAVEEVLVPVEAHFMALVGLNQLFQTVEIVRQRVNPALRIAGILPCRVDQRTRHAQEVIDSLKAQFGGLVLRTAIRENVRLAECPSAGKPIFQFDSRCAGARDYRALAEEIIAQEAGP